MLDDHGLACSLYYTHLGRFGDKTSDEMRGELDLFKQGAEVATALGAPMVSGPPGGKSCGDPEEVFDRAAENIRAALDVLAPHGLKLVNELHFGGLVENADAAVKLADKVNSDDYGFIYDPSNIWIGGFDWGVGAIEKLGDRLLHFHIKDMDLAEPNEKDAIHVEAVDRWFKFTLLGEGAVDHGPLVAELVRRGYEGYYSCECHLPVDPALRAEKELAVLKQYFEAWFESR